MGRIVRFWILRCVRGRCLLFGRFAVFPAGWGSLSWGPIGRGIVSTPRRRRIGRLSSQFQHLGAYAVDVDKCWIGSQLVPIDVVVVDTGTTESFFINTPTTALDLDMGGQGASRRVVTEYQDIRVRLTSGFEMEWPAGSHMLPRRLGQASRSTFHINHPMLNNVFGTRRVLLLGISHMKNRVWTFDCVNDRLGISF